MVILKSDAALSSWPQTTTLTTANPQPTTILRIEHSFAPQKPNEYLEVAMERRPVFEVLAEFLITIWLYSDSKKGSPNLWTKGTAICSAKSTQESSHNNCSDALAQAQVENLRS